MIHAQLTVLTGSLAGRQFTLSPPGITVGRNQDVGLQFDPHQEIHVSGSHAAFTPSEDGWVLQDLGSTNGTFVNGHRLSAPVLLRDGDQIQLGEGGPTLEIRLAPQPHETPLPAEAASPIPAAPPPSAATPIPPATPPPAAQAPYPSPGAIPYSAETLSSVGTRGGGAKGTRWSLTVLTVTLLTVVLMATHSIREGRRYREQMEAMQERIDSILDSSAEAAGALQGRIQGLHDALLESRRNLEDVGRDLEVAQEAGDSEEIQSLRVQLQDAQTALVRHQLAANLDFDAIEAGNRRAVAKVFVDFGGEIVTATAFSVRSNGTLMTNRHVVSGPSGNQRPQRVAVQFADSRQVWPARVLRTSRVDDLALLKVENIVGAVPTIQGFNDQPGSVRAGQGVGVIGFPLGGAEPTDGSGADIARTTLTAGIVQAVGDETLEVNGYGVEGSSGSPVFDGEGQVIGVLFGGRVDEGERTLFAVPAGRALAFLEGIS